MTRRRRRCRGPVLVPAPLARGRAGRRRRAAPPRDGGRARRSCAPAARPSTRRSPRTPSLGVVVPHGCGIGGDAFWLIWDAAERPPARAQRLGPRGRPRPTRRRCAATGLERLPLHGPLTITVPGAVRSWADAHARFGRLLARGRSSRRRSSSPRRGFPAWDGFIEAVEVDAAAWSSSAIGPGPGFARVYRPDGRPWRPGELVRLPALAATLERLADDGFDAFYDGDLGERQAAGLAAAGSPITVGRPARPHARPGATRSRPTTAASGSRPIRRTARASSRSSSSTSSSGSSHRRRPRSAPAA